LNIIVARLSPGAISESSSIHLPPNVASKLAKPVMFPPGWLNLGTMSLATGSPAVAKTIGIVRVSPGNGRQDRACQDDVGLQANQLLRQRSHAIDVIAVPPKIHPQVAAIGPTQARKRFRERRDVSLPHGIVYAARYEPADAPHAAALLRARRQRPSSRAAQPSDEVAPFHSITSVAMA
jgi:hypothetical protein